MVAAPMMAAPIIEAPRMEMAMGGREGFLKIHLKRAELTRHAGPRMIMSPHVLIRMDNFEWRSENCPDGGKEPEW